MKRRRRKKTWLVNSVLYLDSATRSTDRNFLIEWFPIKMFWTETKGDRLPGSSGFTLSCQVGNCGGCISCIKIKRHAKCGSGSIFSSCCVTECNNRQSYSRVCFSPARIENLSESQAFPFSQSLEHMLMHSLLKRKVPLTATTGNYTSNFMLWKETFPILPNSIVIVTSWAFIPLAKGVPRISGEDKGKVLMVKHCHCANNSKVTNECLILRHPFLGMVGCIGGSSSKEASIKFNQHILRINTQNLGEHGVFLHYSHTSADDSAFFFYFCNKNPQIPTV